MDGDIVLIFEICDLVDKYGVMIYLDEVYVVGFYGLCGVGVVECDGVVDCIIIIEGMFGKVFGVMGGYIVGLVVMCDFICSFVSGFIFIIVLLFVVVVGVFVLVKYLKMVQDLCVVYQVKVVKLCVVLDWVGILYIENFSYIIFVMVGDLVKCKYILDWLMVDFGIYIQFINYLIVVKGIECLWIILLLVYMDKQMEVLVFVFNDLWVECQIVCWGLVV